MPIWFWIVVAIVFLVVLGIFGWWYRGMTEL